MNRESRGVVTLWEGEWPWLRQQVAMVRQWVSVFGAIVGSIFDIAGYLATARMYTAQADRFVTEQTSIASEQLRKRRWILPTLGIVSASVFVVTKSAPWGTYRALRNGAITSMLLIAFLFPREIIVTTDAVLPFRTGDPVEEIPREK